MNHPRQLLPPAVAPFALGALLLLLPAPQAAAHSPHDVTPLIAVSPDYANDGIVFASFQFTEYKLLGRSVDGGRSWALYSSAMTVHPVVDLEFSPRFKQDGTIFGATFGGGVWRSVDRGLTWEPINTGLTNLNVRDLSVSPAFGTDQALAVGTFAGCFVSLDGGGSWLPASNGLTETTIVEIQFDPRATALYAGKEVLHRSVDYGATWVPVQTFTNAMGCITFDPGDPSGMIMAVTFGRFGGGVLMSLDGGASFLPSNDGLTDLRVGNVRWAKDGTMLAASFEGGCHLSAGPFSPWAASAEGLEPLSDLSDEHYFLALPSPKFADDGIVLLASFEGFYLSFDAGQTWEQQETYSLRLNRQALFSPEYADDGVLVASSYGAGILVAAPPGSDPGGLPPGTSASPAPAPAGEATLEVADAATSLPHEGPSIPLPSELQWSARSTGLYTIWGSELQFSPTYAQDRALFYAHIGLFRTTDLARHWEQLPMPPGFIIVRALALSPEFASDQTAFIGGGDGQGIHRSADGCQSWVELTGQGGLAQASRASVLAVSPGFARDGTLFLATTNTGVWRGTAGGDAWELLGFDEEQVRALALSPVFDQDDTLFVGMDSLGGFRSTDGGDTWEPLDLGLGGSAGYTVQSFGFSPAFAADGEMFALTRQGDLLRSTDHGQTWEARDAGLTDEALRSVAVSPDYLQDDTLVVSSHDWVWWSRDRGLSWSRLPGWVRVDDSHQAAQVSGTWISYVLPNSIAPGPVAAGEPVHFGPGVRVTTTVGDGTELEFYGTSAAFYAELDPASGIVEALVDGVPAGLLDLYAPESRPRQRVFEHHFDAPGWHTLRMTLTASSNPASSGHELRSDGFHYTFDEPGPMEASVQTAGWSRPYAWLADKAWAPRRERGPLQASPPRRQDEHEGCPPAEALESPDEDVAVGTARR